MVAAAAIGFMIARYAASDEHARGGSESSHADAATGHPAIAAQHGATPNGSEPKSPPEGMPLAAAYDALAARATRGDTDAVRRLLSELVRCRTYSMAGYRPYMEIASVSEAGGTEWLAAWRSELEASEAHCKGLSPAQESSESEWQQRAAETGDPEAMLCFALEPGFYNAGVLSAAWQKQRRRYVALSREYAERAFARGYPQAAWPLYASYAGATPGEPSRVFAIPPGPLDASRAYALARYQAKRLREVVGLRRGMADEWADRADILAEHLSAAERARGDALARTYALRDAPPPLRGLCWSAQVLP